ncbi:hypothetical protein HHK36_019450 [Tetracentron sinense]|uniref:Subtilisin-like protease fibronectin type-III domain-containing protein n=1 Tax=Tetracentron sinense TaxID=13715 RepID=A0A835D9M2_TETSI|nr:hypothetical protein HHK36_019450 [Tetracentron sinense]
MILLPDLCHTSVAEVEKQKTYIVHMAKHEMLTNFHDHLHWSFTLSNSSPWIIIVGAGTLDRVFPAHVSLGNEKNFSRLSGMASSGKPLEVGPGVVASSSSRPKIWSSLFSSNRAQSSRQEIPYFEPSIIDGKKVEVWEHGEVFIEIYSLESGVFILDFENAEFKQHAWVAVRHIDAANDVRVEKTEGLREGFPREVASIEEPWSVVGGPRHENVVVDGSIPKRQHSSPLVEFALGHLNVDETALGEGGGGLIVVNYTRTLTNAGSPTTYTTSVSSETKSVQIVIEPKSLSFEELNEKKMYIVMFTASRCHPG